MLMKLIMLISMSATMLGAISPLISKSANPARIKHMDTHFQDHKVKLAEDIEQLE
jgi:hypothetical protein